MAISTDVTPRAESATAEPESAAPGRTKMILVLGALVALFALLAVGVQAGDDDEVADDMVAELA